ncbi:unnamed protein product [Bursaphelenchus okinawaensis]|uniref:AAA+ ATPase domain-containing protein n=1 Tax=Bursaphelenchus okinawaensis TaxID=465554 RepID=A0A811K8D5_9BILA|nr:unnamed protein product [Bursaphelenchus okinawaensis]CAG9093983.1 unnamed protein product [Bursaphelenchus okinawaensis]
MTAVQNLNSLAIQQRYGNPVWQFFKIDDETLTQVCSHCGQKLNAPPNTTNSKKHLKAKHPDLYEIVRIEDEARQSQKVSRKRRHLSGSETSSCTFSQQDVVYDDNVTKFLEGILQNYKDLPLYLPNDTFSKDEITLSDSSDPSDQEAKPYPDTNFGNNALLSLYSQNKPNSALATVSPTVNNKSLNNNNITFTPVPASVPLPSAQKDSIKDSQEPAMKKRGIRKASALPDKSTVKCQVPSLKRCDLGGVNRQFLEVFHLLMHMKRPEIHNRLHVQPPVGILIHGPPGCGKTRFAQSVAGELDMPLIQVSCTELISGVSGESENKIRQLFQQAKENSPCMVLLDDVDVISSKRDSAQREMERRIVTQLIACLDELARGDDQPCSSTLNPLKLQFASNGAFSIENPNSTRRQVMVMATTSRLESIDMALRRAGRFDKELSLGIPDEKARIEIMKVVCKDMVLNPKVSLKEIARLTPGYVGSDLVALAREASVSAVNRVLETLVPGQHDKRQLTDEEVEREIQNILTWFKSSEQITSEKLDLMSVELKDFARALTIISPSSIREGFATVPDVTWDDVGALSSVRSELEWSILNPIKRPEDFEDLGIDNKPQGILLCGPPGCGKTLLAKAIANESGLNFISVKGPELLSMYVGESERAVRMVFQRARDSAPCVIFFDEIDALCPKRNHNETSGSARLVNQMLTEMDGVEGRKQVFLIGATNRPDIVDPAILRPGRLDKIIFVDFPDQHDRVDILKKLTRDGTHPKISSSIKFEEVASLPELTDYTGADLSALVHEAGILALRERLENPEVSAITFDHFTLASKRINPSVTKADRLKYEQLKDKYRKL